MNLPLGYRPPTDAERTEDFTARRRAIERSYHEGILSDDQLRAAWAELGSFEGYPREIIRRRPDAPRLPFQVVTLSDLYTSRLQEQTKRITELFSRALADAEEKQVIALLRARGYLIARPADQLTDPQRKIAEQSHLIDTLRATIETLRAGKSVPPRAEE